MFKNSLFPKQNGNGETPAPKYPIKIIVTPDEDSKISSYGVGYYVTFLNVEAGEALREYLLQRMRPKTIHIGRGEYTPGGRREYLSETEQLVPKDEDYVFVTEGTVSRGRKLSQVSIRDIVKRAAVKAAIEPETIWPHCFRKGFRKTLYAAGLADDMAEALMGHKLPGSRGNYFDYHDDDMIAKQYLMADFGRTTSSRIVRTEGAIASLQKRLLEVQEENQRTRAENQSLKKQVDEMAAPRAVSGELLAELRRDPQFMAELAKAIRKEVKE
jgi:regulator of replication initiation timing